jgi:hypothetical protein
MLIIGCDFHTRYQQIAMAGGRPLIPKNAFGWPILAGLFHARVGLCSYPFSNFYFLFGRAAHP